MSEGLRLPVVPDWFTVMWVTARTAVLTEPHVDGLIRANRWYLRGRDRDLLVDTGNGVAPVAPVLVDALPHPGFDPAAFRIVPAASTQVVRGGDVVGLGDHRLTVIELPGHTPGSIGLLDDEEGALLSGDAVYEGELIDTLPESDVEQYVRTVEQLRELEVEVGYPGHGRPCGRERLREIAADYLRRRGCAAAGGRRYPVASSATATQVRPTPTICPRESRSRRTNSPRSAAMVPPCETTTEAMATGPTLIAAASATNAAASKTPANAARRARARGSLRPASMSATGTSTTIVPSRP